MNEVSLSTADLLKKIEELKRENASLKESFNASILEREAVKKSQDESQELFKAILHASPDDITITDLEGKVLLVSSKALTMFGYERKEEIIGHNLIEFLAPEDIDRARNNIGLMFRGTMTGPGEYIGVRKDGSRFEIETNGEFIRDSNGNPVKIVFIVRDISERKLIEKSLRESEERFRKLLQSVPTVAVQGYDCHGITNYWNKASEDLYGYSSDEAIGRPLTELIIPPEMRGEVEKAMEFMFTSGTPIPASELSLMRKGGGRVSVFSSHAVINIPGRSTELFCIDIDLTESKNAEAALRESEANFHSFFETMSDMIFVASPDCKILFTNTLLRKKLGYNEDELLLMRIPDFHKKKDRLEVEKLFEAMLKEKIKTCSIPVVTKSGVLIPVESRLWIGSWNGNECIFCIIKDLTSEEDAKQRFEHLFRNNPAPMALTAMPERVFIDVNDKFLKLFGYTKDELIGKTSADVNLFPNTNPVNIALNKLSKDGNFNDMEIQAIGKDGIIHDGLFSGEIIYSRGKQYLLTVMIDITERKQIERELHIKTSELDRYFTSSLDLLCIANTAGQFVRLNPEWESVLGYPIDELQGSKFIDYVHPNDVAVTLEALSALAMQKEVTSFENRYRCKDGSYKWIEWRSKPEGDTIYAAARDVTFRKTAEEKIRNLLKEKELLLQEVHHRIKNNMSTIYSLLILQSDTQKNSYVREVLNDAASRVHSMGLLYDKLYRSEFIGDVKIKEYFPVLINEIVNLFPQKEKVKINTQIDDIVLNVKTLSSLGIIINELITNSMKYAFNNRNEGLIDFTLTENHNRIKMTVEDNGSSLPDSFSLEDSSGFGIQLVKILVHQLSGTISFKQDKGACFIIEFNV